MATEPAVTGAVSHEENPEKHDQLSTLLEHHTQCELIWGHQWREPIHFDQLYGVTHKSKWDNTVTRVLPSGHE